jgi:hypothetical protein
LGEVAAPHLKHPFREVWRIIQGYHSGIDLRNNKKRKPPKPQTPINHSKYTLA